VKGNEKIIATLNALLADELTAISQYMVHSELCANWGFERLHEAVEKRAITEMRHAESLIGRVIFLEGNTIVSKLNQISVGSEVEAQLKNDLAAELGAVKSYTEGVALAVGAGDNGTRALLESILKDEEEHVDWIEAQQDLIGKVGLQNYLAQQIK
jgi:bacterioferritin